MQNEFPDDGPSLGEQQYLADAMRGPPALPQGSTGLLEVPTYTAPAHQLTNDQMDAVFDNALAEMIAQHTYTAEQVQAIYAAKKLLGCNSQYLDRVIIDTDDLLQHIAHLAAEQYHERGKKVNANNIQAALAKRQRWDAYLAACQERKGRIAAAKQDHLQRKEQMKAAIAPAQQFIAQWEQYVKAGYQAFVEASKEPAPPRPE